MSEVGSSVSSRRSKVTISHAQARADLAMAKARSEFAKKRAGLLRMQAIAEADVRVLDAEEHVAVCQARADSLLGSSLNVEINSDFDTLSVGNVSDVFSDFLTDNDSVNDQITLNEAFVPPPSPNHVPVLENDEILPPPFVNQASNPEHELILPPPSFRDDVQMPFNVAVNLENPTVGVKKELEPQENSIKDNRFCSHMVQPPETSTVMTEIGNVLFRKELLSSSLRQFDDTAASYRAWKITLSNTIKELNVPTNQEINVVMKWLGEKSRQLVAPLHAVYIEDPCEALRHVWNLLDETYGAPEAVEKCLTKRLQDFPKFNLKETRHTTTTQPPFTGSAPRQGF
ncbi:uncharacterized protein LOC117123726, partial [Anneissia japonica]|uniref:uncharacterized protein LOC117123726 n=1 Tax=Anneissia japonica TaxID=1529436 RepID=UPI0014258F45